MIFGPQTRFSMCSLYPRNDRAICACFLGKDDRIVDDLVALHSEALLWPGGGSGVISLADLEAELSGKRAWDKQGRCDVEFIKSCHACGIKIFAVVFTAQGYEISLELNQDESEILSFGKILGKGKPGTWGLDEFYQDRYPKIYKSFRNFFSPERLAIIEKALARKNFLEQSACRDLHGDKSRCNWVMSSGLARDLQYDNFFMCKNSPLWREHLKAIIEMQVDAGFDGIQFDEPGLSMEVGGTRAGFCEHCQEQFKSYMVERYGDKFKSLDYPGLLKKNGAGILSELAYFKGMPFWQDWKRSLLVDAKRNFSELVDHARAYAKTKGKEIPIAANFAFWMPHHLVLSEMVDVFSLEYNPAFPPARTNIIYPEIGLALDDKKPVTMVPHIAFTAHLRERAKIKKPDGSRGDVNLLRYLIAEAAFAGGDFMVPYSCLCLTGEGAYFPPVDEISGWLKFAKDSREKWRDAKNISQASVVLSFPSYFWGFDFLNMPGKHFASLEAITHFLQTLGVQYRIVIWGDDDFLKGRGEIPDGEFLILPNVSHITDSQIDKLRRFIEAGGQSLVIGRCGVRDSLNQERDASFFSSLKPGANSFGKGVLFFSPDDPAKKNRGQSSRGNDRIVKEWLAGMGLKPRVFVNNPSGFAPLLRLSDAHGKMLVKMLNRNFHYHEDFFTPVKDAELVIEKSFGHVPKGFLMTSPEGKTVEVRGNSSDKDLRFKLPGFEIYACMEEIG